MHPFLASKGKGTSNSVPLLAAQLTSYVSNTTTILTNWLTGQKKITLIKVAQVIFTSNPESGTYIYQSLDDAFTAHSNMVIGFDPFILEMQRAAKKLTKKKRIYTYV